MTDLLALWHESRDRALGDALAAKSPVPLGLKPAQVTTQLETVPPVSPGLVLALEQLLREPPFTSDSSKPAWALVFAAVERTNDPRFVDLAKTLPPTWKVRPLFADWLGRRLEACVKKLKPVGRPLTEAELAGCHAVLSAPTKTGALSVDEAVRAVWANPDSVEVRAVCADALQEAADVRGEFIRLQLLDDPASRKAAASLQKKHLPALLGELAPVITKQGAVFRRGFLAEAVAKFKNQQDAERYGSLEAWSTVEKLSFSSSAGMSLAPGSPQFKWTHYLSPQLVSLRELGYFPAASVEFLLAAHRPWRLETLTIGALPEGAEGHSLVKQVVTSPLVPALRSLRLHRADPSFCKALLGSRALRVVELDEDAVASLTLEQLQASKLDLVVFHLTGSARLEWRRDGEGRFTRLSITCGEEFYAARMEAALAEFPGWATECVLVDRPLNPDWVSRVKKSG